MVTPKLDFLVTVSAKDKEWHEMIAETTGVSPRVGLMVRYEPDEVDSKEFDKLFAYLLRQVEGDALITVDDASPMLLRKDRLITIEPDTFFNTDASLRAELPPPVKEGIIPW